MLIDAELALQQFKQTERMSNHDSLKSCMITLKSMNILVDTSEAPVDALLADPDASTPIKQMGPESEPERTMWVFYY